MEIKIRKNTYTITKEDRFMDTGRYIALLTQGNTPKLPAYTIEKLKRINVVPGATRSISTFSLDI